jgi:predicted nucleic acid-binding protein
MPVLDSSFLVDLVRGDERALKALAWFENEYHDLSTTVINLLELFRGVYLSERKEENMKEVMEIARGLDLLGIGWETFQIYGTLSATLRTSGVAVDEFDVVIAALAFQADGRIVTRDQHFRQIPGLEVISY